ncbi:hypothetical protein BKA66DRAFT_440710 [Pyrenochaeta sp. MPI-SDFR-AT-0127]|nr:hypothetical protein BKA66DRAFT_440710 [Pyrenochaeta sp. MPI-SDFR-AT-0127]
MPDPFSVAASVVSVTVPALHGARLLLNDLISIIDAPRTIRSLEEDISSTLQVRDAFENVAKREWQILGQTVADQAETSIRQCDEACGAFRTDIQKWTRHSKDNTLSFRDKTMVGFFKDRQITAMSAQLQSCKISLTSAIGIATLYSSIRNFHISEDLRRSTESNVSDAITSTKRQLAGIEQDLDQLRGDNTEQVDECSARALRQLREKRTALDCSCRLLEMLRQKASAEAVAEVTSKIQEQTISITFGDNNKGFQTGIINGAVSGLTFGG